MLDELTTGTLQLEIAAGGKEGLRKVLEDAGDTESLEDLDGTWQMMSDFDSYTLRTHPNQHLSHIFDMLPGITRVMLARTWAVVRFERKTLLTSDEPVVLLPGQVGTQFMGVGLLSAPEILVPLSRRTGLWLGEVQTDIDEAQWGDGTIRLGGTTVLANTFNGATIRNARRALLVHPDDRHLLDTALPKPRTQELTGFDPHAWLRTDTTE